MTTPTLEHRSRLWQILPTTIVTGATSGIGWELAMQLAHAGVRVIAIGRRLHELQGLAAHSPLIIPWTADLAEIERLPALAADILAAHPDAGCLINNAGIQDNLRMDDADYGHAAVRREVDVNLVAPMVLTQLLLPHLKARQRSWVVNVTSVLGHAPKRTAAVYSATKAGLHTFTRALRVQMQGSAVTVAEALMPLVDTPMTQGRGRGKMPVEDAARALLKGLSSGHTDIRIGKARAVPVLQRWAPGILSRIIQRQ